MTKTYKEFVTEAIGGPNKSKPTGKTKKELESGLKKFVKDWLQQRKNNPKGAIQTKKNIDKIIKSKGLNAHDVFFFYGDPDDPAERYGFKESLVIEKQLNEGSTETSYDTMLWVTLSLNPNMNKLVRELVDNFEITSAGDAEDFINNLHKSIKRHKNFKKLEDTLMNSVHD